MTGRDRGMGDLLLAIHAAAVEPRGWDGVLDRLADRTGAQGVNLVLWCRDAPARTSVRVGRGDPALAERYLAHHQRNPWAEAAVHVAPGAVLRTEALTPYASLRRTAFAADLLDPVGTREAVCVRYDLEPDWTVGGFALLFDARDERAPERAVPLLGRLSPHLDTALKTTLLLGEIGQARDALAAALDRLDRAALLVGARGELRHANACAAGLLDRRDGLTLARGRLAALTPPDTERLLRLVAAASRAGEGAATGAGGALRLARPRGAAPLQLEIRPVPATAAAGPQRPTAIVLATGPGVAPAPAEGRLRERWGLTPTEAQVATGLAAGRSLTAIATLLGLGHETARSHLKRAFLKTGTRSQLQLGLLAAGMPVDTGPRRRRVG